MTKLYEIVLVHELDVKEGFNIGEIIHAYDDGLMLTESITLHKFFKNQLKELF